MSSLLTLSPYPKPKPVKTILIILEINNENENENNNFNNIMDIIIPLLCDNNGNYIIVQNNEITNNYDNVSITEKNETIPYYLMVAYLNFSNEIYELIKNIIFTTKNIIINTISSKIPDEPDCLIIKIISTSLFNNINLNLINKYGHGLLNLAILNNDARMLKYILDIDIDSIDINIKHKISYKSYQIALYFSISCDNINNIDFVRVFIESMNNYSNSKIDINARDIFGSTPLINACMFNNNTKTNNEIIIYLLKHPKINVLLKNSNGYNALICSVIQNNITIISYILKHPVYRNMTATQNQTIYDTLLEYTDNRIIIDYLYDILFTNNTTDIDKLNDNIVSTIINELKNKSETEIDDEITIIDEPLQQKLINFTFQNIITYFINYNIPLYIMLFCMLYNMVYGNLV